MATYRESRNFELSIITAIESALTAGGWTGVTVVKSFAKAYDVEVPVISVHLGSTDHAAVEIGTTATRRTVTAFINLFATSIGQAEDIKDALISSLKGGFTYYTVVVTNNVSQKTSAGWINIKSIKDTPVNLGDSLDKVDANDKFRWLITLQLSNGKYEV